MAAWSADLSRVAGTVSSLPSAGLDKAVAQIASAITVMPEMQVPKLVAGGTLGAVAEIAEDLRLTERRYASQLSEWSSALSGFQNEIAQVTGAVTAVSSVEVPRLVGTTLAAISEALEASDISQITGAVDGAVSAAQSTLAPLQEFASQTADWAAAVAQVGVPDILSEDVRGTIDRAAEALDTSSLAAAFDGAVSAARSTLAPLQEFASQTADWAAAVAQVGVPDPTTEGTPTTLASAGWALDSSQLAAALTNVELFREQFKATNPFDSPAECTRSPITEPSLAVVEGAGERLLGADAEGHRRLAAPGPTSEAEQATQGVAQAAIAVALVVALAATTVKSLDTIVLAGRQVLEAAVFLCELTSVFYSWLSDVLPDDNAAGWAVLLASMFRRPIGQQGGRR